MADLVVDVERASLRSLLLCNDIDIGGRIVRLEPKIVLTNVHFLVTSFDISWCSTDGIRINLLVRVSRNVCAGLSSNAGVHLCSTRKVELAVVVFSGEKVEEFKKIYVRKIDSLVSSTEQRRVNVYLCSPLGSRLSAFLHHRSLQCKLYKPDRFPYSCTPVVPHAVPFMITSLARGSYQHLTLGISAASLAR